MNQKIELIEIQEKLIRGDYSKCVKELNKRFREEKIDERNRSLFYFLSYVASKGINDNENSEIWFEKLKSNTTNTIYLKRAEKLLGQS